MLINKLLKPFSDLWFDMTKDVRWFWKYSIFIFLYVSCLILGISLIITFYTLSPLFDLYDKIPFKKFFRKIFYKTP